MARAKRAGNGRLEEAMADLVQAQAALRKAQAELVQTEAVHRARDTDFHAKTAEARAQFAETNRINAEQFARIIAILHENKRLLLALPDVICEMIGIKTPSP